MTYSITNFEGDIGDFTLLLVRDGVVVAEVTHDDNFSVDHSYEWLSHEEEVLFDNFSSEDGMDEMIDKLIEA